MSVQATRDDGPWIGGSAPAPEFTITGAAHVPFAAAPTMRFTVTATEPGGAEVQSIALGAQVMIDPARRGYEPETRARLAELFGPPASWAPSTSGLPWARVTAVVPGFAGSTTFALEVPCSYDLEVAAAKYFYAVRDGLIPLTFHFNGTVFYRDRDGRLQVIPISWSSSSPYRMEVAAWRAMIAEHYPGGGWIRLADATLAALHERRTQRGLSSLDAAVAQLLHEADERQA
jgi:hypothetical protein